MEGIEIHRIEWSHRVDQDAGFIHLTNGDNEIGDFIAIDNGVPSHCTSSLRLEAEEPYQRIEINTPMIISS